MKSHPSIIDLVTFVNEWLRQLITCIVYGTVCYLCFKVSLLMLIHYTLVLHVVINVCCSFYLDESMLMIYDRRK